MLAAIHSHMPVCGRHLSQLAPPVSQDRFCACATACQIHLTSSEYRPALLLPPVRCAAKIVTLLHIAIPPHLWHIVEVYQQCGSPVVALLKCCSTWEAILV